MFWEVNIKMLLVDKQNCRGCGVCVHNAPKGAIVMKDGVATIVENKCKNEQECIDACPFGVITKK